MDTIELNLWQMVGKIRFIFLIQRFVIYFHQIFMNRHHFSSLARQIPFDHYYQVW